MKRYSFIGPIVFLLIWAIVSKFHFVDSFFLPNPWITFSALFGLLFNGVLSKDIFITLERVAAAFFIAGVVGIPLGLFLGSSEKIYRSVEFLMDFFRSTPATAIFPLFLLIFGVADASKIAVAAFSAFIIITFNTAYGVLGSKKSRLLVAKIMGDSRWGRLRHVLFWESLPQTFIGLRQAVSLSLVIVVVTEMFIGTTVGIGRKIIDFQITYNVPQMYATIIIAGILGYMLNLGFLLLERRVLHWTTK